MKILTSLEDFREHQKKLDEQYLTTHIHNGNPKEFPCKVKSTRYSNYNFPDEFEHQFVYLMTVVCPDCGHKTQFWPTGWEDFCG